MKFTTSLKADKKIQDDFEIIKGIILRKLNPKAIVMFGGFGHGGGSFKEKNSKILPLNDYDLYVITDKNLDDEMLERMGEECSRALNRGGLEIVENFNEKYDENKFFHVDLHCMPYSKLKKMLPTQRTADLKTSLVLYGDKDILNQIPKLKISKSDAFRLLFNKFNHFSIAENNLDIIKSIYAVKGFTDSCSALLIFYDKYVSTYQERAEVIQTLDLPKEYKQFVKEATDAKLNHGYAVKDVDAFFESSKKWIQWVFKKIAKEHLNIKSNDWKEIIGQTYKKLPLIYFDDYLGRKGFFFLQYYLNIRFFLSGLRKGKFLFRNLFRWRDAGIIVALALISYFVGEKEESRKYLRKLTSDTNPLKDKIMELYSIYYLQKLI